MRLEMRHATEPDSGYGTLVRQIRRGFAELGEPLDTGRLPGLFDRLVHRPRVPELVEFSHPTYGTIRRWVDRATGEVVKTGTEWRRWVTNHDMPALLGVAEAEAPRMRDAVRIVPDTPLGAVYEGAGRRINFTMWESSELPTQLRPWKPHLEKMDTVLVPSAHSKQLVLDLLPRADVREIPLALEPDQWPTFDRRGRRGAFVFLLVGDLSIRKGFDLAYQAFWEEFGGRAGVHLVLKARGQADLCQVGRVEDAIVDGRRVAPRHRNVWRLDFTDPQVRALRGDWSRRSLLELYRSADCFLWPSRGEGWGYPPREAAATGLPVISPAHTGMADADQWAYVIGHGDGQPARVQAYGVCGHWQQPSLEELRRQMRWVYENRDQAQERGLAAAEYVRRRTHLDLAADVRAVMQEVA